MKIERTRIDGEPVRRFHLLAEVTFRDRNAEDRPRANYYEDRVLKSLVTEWMCDGLVDRDDSPAVRFWTMDPGPEGGWHVDHPVTRLVWQWIIDANNGHGD